MPRTVSALLPSASPRWLARLADQRPPGRMEGPGIQQLSGLTLRRDSGSVGRGAHPELWRCRYHPWVKISTVTLRAVDLGETFRVSLGPLTVWTNSGAMSVTAPGCCSRTLASRL